MTGDRTPEGAIEHRSELVDAGLLIGAVKGLATALRAGIEVDWLPGGDVARWVAGQRLQALGQRDVKVAAEWVAIAAEAADGGDGALEQIWAADAARVAAAGQAFASTARALLADQVPAGVQVQGLAALELLFDAAGRVSVLWALHSAWGWLRCGPVMVDAAHGVPAEAWPLVVERLSAVLLPSPVPEGEDDCLGEPDDAVLAMSVREPGCCGDGLGEPA